MVQLFGNLADGQTVSMQLTDSSIVVHRKHPCPPAAASAPHAGMCYGVSLFDADRVSLRDADHHTLPNRPIVSSKRPLPKVLSSSVRQIPPIEGGRRAFPGELCAGD